MALRHFEWLGFSSLAAVSALVAGCASDASQSRDLAAPAGVDSTSGGSSSGGTGAVGAGDSGGTLAIDPGGSETGSGAATGVGGSTGGTHAGGGSSGAAGTTFAGLPESGEDGDDMGTGGTGSGGTGGTAPSGPGDGNIQSGTLTAGAWDDNLNFDFFLAYRRRMDVLASPGLLPVDEAEYQAAHALLAQSGSKKETLDLSLVIDTTGSMGDEIRYLQTELIQLSAKIGDDHPNAEQRWSLVLYRDEGDEYVVRSFDFVEDIAEFQANLAVQEAAGGGDMPEAPEQALIHATELSWRDDEATARMAFWIADAPPHPENVEAMATAIRDIGALGVHVYPVASSGIDEITELTMRSAAQLTGGRYLFLTDDSGVGGPHKEPTIPCYFVTKLDDAIARMVDIELSGKYHEPDADEVIRTGGDPSSGRCKLESGDSVVVY